MIGLIAQDIRGDWSNYVHSRIGCIEELYDLLKEMCPYIDEDAAIYDGRWFRDCWDGPYGGNQDEKDYTPDGVEYLNKILQRLRLEL